eukprot:g31548.t1
MLGKRVFGALDTEEGGSKQASVTLSVIAGEGRRGAYVPGGGILLEQAEIVADGPLDVDADGMEGSGKAGVGCALDCGAGIGRITKRLLLPMFKVVDMVDVTESFLTKAKAHLGEEGNRVGNYYCCGLQDFVPQPQRYDVIWIQWVI